MSMKNSEIYNRNLEKLDSMSRLEKNWAGDDTFPPSKDLIERIRKMLSVLGVQPDIFPTRYGEIRLEFYGENDSFFRLLLPMVNRLIA